VGIESTVIDLSGNQPTILRPGGVSQQQIESLIGPVCLWHGAVAENEAATSPGQSTVHYAPKATAYRFEAQNLPRVHEWCRENLKGRSAAIVKCSPPQNPDPRISNLQFQYLSSNPTHYAQQLYATLRHLDTQGIQVVFLEMPPSDDAWNAVTDRLARASKPLP
jgi:L-threonylcarbamoyladenylate synthase